jgi:ribonuclease HI
VYTDGSFATNSAGSAIITNSVLVLSDPDASSLAIFGRCLTPDPFAAELSALILALQSTHPESELFLISDCLGALQILQQLYTRPFFPTYRSTHAFFLNQIRTQLNMREAPLHLTWLRSHQNHPLNDKADYFAKLARLPSPR